MPLVICWWLNRRWPIWIVDWIMWCRLYNFDRILWLRDRLHLRRTPGNGFELARKSYLEMWSFVRGRFGAYFAICIPWWFEPDSSFSRYSSILSPSFNTQRWRGFFKCLWGRSKNFISTTMNSSILSAFTQLMRGQRNGENTNLLSCLSSIHSAAVNAIVKQRSKFPAGLLIQLNLLIFSQKFFFQMSELV